MVDYVVDDYEISSSQTGDRESTSKINWWKKIVPGAHFARLLPVPKSMANEEGKAPFYCLVPIHFGIHPGNKRIVYCPRKASKGQLPCAICEMWLPFVRKDSTATAQERKVAIDHLPKWMNYMNLILLDNTTGEPMRDKDGAIRPMVWGAGNEIIDQILRRMEEYKEENGVFPSLTHPKNGLIIRVHREGTEREDTKWDATLKKPYDITPYAEWWEDAIVDLPTINPPVTPEVVERLVAGGTSTDAFERKELAAPANASGAFEDDPAIIEGEVVHVDDPAPEDTGSANAFEDDEPAAKPKEATKGKGKGSTRLAALLGEED